MNYPPDTSDFIPLNSVDRHVGARVRARRLFLQMKEQVLAEKLSVSVDELRGYEAGTIRIGFETQREIARVLGVADRYFYLNYAFGSGTPESNKARLREVDLWFITHLFPHENALIAVARRMTGNTETARDLVQNIYAEILADDKWKTVENPRAYAISALRNRGNSLVKRARIVPIELVANMETLKQVDHSPGASDVLFAKEKREIILEAIEGLPPQCRKVVKMRRFMEMPPNQIAAKLGISVSAVAKLLSRGMLSLSRSLTEYEGGISKPSLPRTDDKAASE